MPIIPRNNEWKNLSVTPEKCHIMRRKFNSHDIIALTLIYLLSSGSIKDLSTLFMCTDGQFSVYSCFGLDVFIKTLIIHPFSKVHWNMDVSNLKLHANNTQDFNDCPNVVGFIDGKLFSSLVVDDFIEQNGDFNGCKILHCRRFVFIWDSLGKVMACGVKFSGSFDDSSNT